MGVIWKLTPFGKQHRGLTGVPWRDLSEAEYQAAVELHPGIEDQGYFIQMEEPGSEPVRNRSKRAQEED